MNKEEERNYVFAQLSSLPNAFQYVSVTNYIENLEQENKQLKEHIEKYEHYCKTTGIEEIMKENKKYKEVIDKIKEYITIYRSYEDINGKDYLKGRDEIGTLSLSQVDKLLDILKEVE